MAAGTQSSAVLVTGATGFVGRYVVRDLVRRGVKCVAAHRPGRGEALRVALSDVGVLPSVVDSCELDLTAETTPALPSGVASVVHAAAVTKFAAGGRGEPDRTNVGGLRSLLSACDAAGVREVHLVSTAFACGRTASPVAERVEVGEPDHRNDYERSKWRAERLFGDWLDAGGRSGTILRPSIVVGEFESGRASKYDGFYLLARATKLLANAVRDRGGDPSRVALRIAADPNATQNLVPVDYVSSLIAAVVTQPTSGQVIHLTHPRPPTNALIKLALERHFGLSGGSFAEGGSSAGDDQRLFDEVAGTVADYLAPQPTFLRDAANAIERSAGVTAPAWAEADLVRLIAAADADDFGRTRRGPRREAGNRSNASAIDRYFCEFLPSRISLSEVARAVSMDVRVRFEIDRARHPYICDFRGGRLWSLSTDGGEADVVYRCDADTFWAAIGGQSHPETYFLEGRAEVEGDIERGLKLGVVLAAFNREFPCTAETLCPTGGAE